MTHFTYQQGRQARFPAIQSRRSGIRWSEVSRHCSGLRILAMAGGVR